jgi:hypothetical protein
MRNQICIVNYLKPWSKQTCLFDLLCKRLAGDRAQLLDFPSIGGQPLAIIAEKSRVARTPLIPSGDAGVAWHRAMAAVFGKCGNPTEI